MGNSKVENLTDAALAKQLKNYKTAVWLMAVATVAYGIYMFYLMLNGKWQVNGTMNLMFFPVFAVFFSVIATQQRAYLGELKKRQNEKI